MSSYTYWRRSGKTHGRGISLRKERSIQTSLNPERKQRKTIKSHHNVGDFQRTCNSSRSNRPTRLQRRSARLGQRLRRQTHRMAPTIPWTRTWNSCAWGSDGRKISEIVHESDAILLAKKSPKWPWTRRMAILHGPSRHPQRWGNGDGRTYDYWIQSQPASTAWRGLRPHPREALNRQRPIVNVSPRQPRRLRHHEQTAGNDRMWGVAEGHVSVMRVLNLWEIKVRDIIYKKQRLALTSIWGRQYQAHTEPSKRKCLNAILLVGIPIECAIFADDLTGWRKSEITDIMATLLGIQEFDI